MLCLLKCDRYSAPSPSTAVGTQGWGNAEGQISETLEDLQLDFLNPQFHSPQLLLRPCSPGEAWYSRGSHSNRWSWAEDLDKDNKTPLMSSGQTSGGILLRSASPLVSEKRQSKGEPSLPV